MPRKIAIVTGSRAEYGLLKELISLIAHDSDSELQLYVTGMHLEKKYGHTVDQIRDDGFTPTATIKSLEEGNSQQDVLFSLANGIRGFAKEFEKFKPDVVVVLGDRYESFAAAQACMIFSLPLAHIHGGEVTEGAFDDAIRHSISKMANIHFPAAEDYKRRLIQLGENEKNIFNFGAPGLDPIGKLKLLSKEELSKSLGIALGEFALLTFHPVTRDYHQGEKSLRILIEELLKSPLDIVITRPNADPGSDRIRDILQEYETDYDQRVHSFESLGQLRYLSAMKHTDLVIGNSSSGIIEAPFFKVPTIDIGDRQKGRLRADSIIHCEGEAEEIQMAIKKALSPEFKEQASKSKSLYGNGHANEKIFNILKEVDLQACLKKEFKDLPSE